MMPRKDPEARKAYHREYMRKRRAKMKAEQEERAAAIAAAQLVPPTKGE